MVGMTQATSRTRHRWTRAERDALPDDGRRHEIIDGELYVSASPRPRHQLMSAELHALLLRACHEHPELELRAFAAPTDVALADDTVMVPDLIVVPFALIAERDIPGAPLIVVEILSPSTRSVDLVIKKDRLRRAGAAQYWVADPAEPSLTIWRLEGGPGGDYVEAGRARGGQSARVTEPFELEIVPAELVRLPGRG